MKYVFLLFKHEFRLLFVTSVEDYNRNTFSVSQIKVSVSFEEHPPFFGFTKDLTKDP